MARRSDYSLAVPHQPRLASVETARHLASVARQFVAGKAGKWDVEEAYRLWEDAVRREKQP